MTSQNPTLMRVPFKIDRLLHGGDYNPDQWLHMPEVFDEDDRLMDLAHCNAFSLGIFSWAALEPEEGKFTFDWLDGIMERMAKKGRQVFLATPSAGMPHWMAAKYPEILRMNQSRVRALPGTRVSYCLSSPVYREKVRIVNRQLAERYKGHPALLLWHISNELGGSFFSTDCHCDLCQAAFRDWLRVKYHDDLGELNRAWWNGFWSHTYTDWNQIQSPAPHGECSIFALALDWKRFVTDQTVDFYRNEAAPLREISPEIPITTNFMGLFPDLNPAKFANELDVVCWDNYPRWHASGDDPSRFTPGTGTWGWHASGEDWRLANDIAFVHDLNRAIRHEPFLMMESTPSMTNWQQVAKLKRPGMHKLSSLQAVAHGSDAVLYFQWRKGRGGFEKYHGAVIDHAGHENTRVFREVADLGEAMERMSEVAGSKTDAEAAVICDWENRWAIELSSGPRWKRRDHVPTCQDHYRPFWKRGVAVDVIGMDQDFSRYKVLIAPMLYMLRPGVAERIDAFVKAGGTFVMTYWSAMIDENDGCFLGGFPGDGLRKVMGVWNEEIDSLYESESRKIVAVEGNAAGLSGEYEAKHYCELLHAETAEVVASYGEDFYKDMPAVTVNKYGEGEAWYIASRNEERFTDQLCASLIERLGLKRALDTELPEGVNAQKRVGKDKEFVFLMNFTGEARKVDLPRDGYMDMERNQAAGRSMTLEPWGVAVLAIKR